ncbi:MAG: TetR/AcrR family transcriptional regulator [Pseudomonadota bacterium]
MENRERAILDAATQVFLRYGVKRASMGDIAAEAGVARQTLYNFYSNKDDILRGSIRMYGEDAMDAIKAELPKAPTLGAQVDIILREMVIKPFVFLHTSPNAQDLFEGYNAAGRSEMEANYQAFQTTFQKVFEPFAASLRTQGLTPALLAELLRRSASAIKHQAKDERHLSKLAAGLRSMAVAATGEGATKGQKQGA